MEIWGHRGAFHFAPENTLAAFQTAADMGADGVEFDVQLTKDGEVVVIHDEKIDRTSDGHGYVKDFTLSDIKRFNFNKRGVTPPFFMPLPTLEETLALLAPTRLKINIELKTGIVFYDGLEEKAFNIAARRGILDRVVWSSFNHYSIRRVKQLDPRAETALLCGGGVIVTGEACEKTGASALHPELPQLRCPGLAEDCRARGIKIRVWTVNEPEDIQWSVEKGADGVFTNRIDTAVLCRERLSGAVVF